MMLWASILSLGTAFVSTAAALKGAEVVSGAYIVEFEPNHDANSFYNALGTHSVAAKPRQRLDSSIFNGASFQLQNISVANVDTAAQQIAGMASVKKIWPVRMIKRPDDIVHFTGNDRIKAQEVMSKRQSTNATDTFSTHVMTQVDKLHAQKIKGKGIRIAVVDTGIDYMHPALGRGFGPGFLVSYGMDLAGDNYTGFNTPIPDKDPIDTCGGHGTHVAGIIAAQTNPFGFTGAAPDVTLGAYRVFGCPENGQASNDILIAAYLKAYQDGSNIITASIGGASGWSEDPWSVVVQRIVEAGVPCTVSAGNDGSVGLFYSSTAANGKKVTAIASVDNSVTPSLLLAATFSTQNQSTKEFGWSAGSPSNWGNISLPLWTPGYNASDPAHGCGAYPENTPDLSKYVVVIRRGTCTFLSKALNAASHGARYIMFANNAPGVTSASASVGDIQGVGMVTADQGVEWINQLAKNITVTVNIVDPKFAMMKLSTDVNKATGGFPSTYSSWGPTFEVDLKPQVAAPGGLILSTWPVALGSYAVLSGTSMACPLAAAIVALIAQVRGTFDPAIIENVMSATANPNLFNDGTKTYPYLAPVAQQGAGLVQAYDAAYAKTLLSVSGLSFNDTDHFVTQSNFTITNTGDEEVTYSLSHVGAATGYTLNPNSSRPAPFPNELTTDYATLVFNEDKVTIPGGGKAVVSVTPTAPSKLTASRLPVYGGYIVLNATNGESLSLPYIGVVGSLHSATVLDKANTYLTQASDASQAPVPPNSPPFELLKVNGTNTTAVNFPVIGITLAMGSALVEVEALPQSSSNTTGIMGAKSLGNIFGFPAEYQPRGALLKNWDGKLQNGTFAPAGKYRFLVRALKIFGDRTKAEEYETKETIDFTIKYV